MQHKEQIESAHRDKKTYRYDDCFDLVRNQISDADIAVGNLEVTLGGTPYSGYPTFSSPDDYAVAIKNAGFDILVTTNNHCLDRGNRGLIRTLDVLDSLKIKHIGTYRNKKERDITYPLIIEINGIKIALLAYTYATNITSSNGLCIVNRIDTAQMAIDIHKARTMHADCIITYLHWGEEYKLTPEKHQEELASWLISNGVDHIIGSHPHVVQPIAFFPDKNIAENHLIVYSLGNYISNMSASNTDNGLSVSIKLFKYYSNTKLLECRYNQVWTERPLDNENKPFRIIPDYYKGNTLSSDSKQRMENSLNKTRILLAPTDSFIKPIYKKQY
jgi:poly-gamma-glutamate capsule biosynthesis protein CapA/YwtB (metallophosphatase superfamily)